MTFRTGFAVKQDLSLLDWDLVDAGGSRCVVSVVAPQWADRGTLVEVDDQTLRVRLRVDTGVYLTTEMTAHVDANVVDLAKYGAGRIKTIMSRQDAKLVAEAAPSWIDNKQQFWWTKNIPWQLELADMKVGQHFRAVRATEDYLVIARTGLPNAIEWIIPMTDINLADLEFDYSAQELQQRREVRANMAELPLLSSQQAIRLLTRVSVVAPFVTGNQQVRMNVAGSDGEFEAATPTHIRASGIPLMDINAFTVTSSDPTTILLRPGAQGVGTEVHEMLHAVASKDYAEHSWFFFDEGLTEYFTRKATAGQFHRGDKYPAEYEFIDRLVKIGATNDALLARLYFAGDWVAFTKGLRRFTGPLASLRILHAANWANCLAIVEYLEELHRNNKAPLGRENAFSF